MGFGDFACDIQTQSETSLRATSCLLVRAPRQRIEDAGERCPLDGRPTVSDVDTHMSCAASRIDSDGAAKIRAGKPPGSELSALMVPTAIKRAVNLFCSRESARYERLDPRFKVGVRMGELDPTYEVTAKETVEARLVVTAADKKRNVQALRDFFNYRGKLVLDSADLPMEGSALIRADEVAATH
jgi:hypothetical protein